MDFKKLLEEAKIENFNVQNPSHLLLGATVLLGSYYLLKPSHQMKINVSGPSFHSLPINPWAIDIALHFDQVHDKLDEFAEKHGEVSHLNLFGVSTLVVRDNDIIKKILGNRSVFLNQPSFRRALSYSLGKSSSMFASEGDVWKARHKVLEPMHKVDFLKFHVKTISETMTKITNLLSQAVGNEPEMAFNFVPALQRATIDIIGQAVFGLDFGVVTTDYKDLEVTPRLANNFLVLLDAISRRLQLPEALWALNFYLSDERRAANEMKALFLGFLRAHEEKMEKGEIEEGKKTTLLQLILEFRKDNPELADQVYPEDGIIQECFSFFGAGHDTTTNTSSFLLWHLATYQEYQQKVYEEIMSVVEGKEGKEDLPSYEEINGLEYTGLFIKESQRYLPTVSSLPRYTANNYQIDGINFPKGTQVLLATKKVQNMEKYHEDFSTFDPERWRHADKDAPFYPFGYGVRMCFGHKLAVLELKTLLYTLLPKYKIEIDPSHPPSVEFTFGITPSKKQAWVKLVPRK